MYWCPDLSSPHTYPQRPGEIYSQGNAVSGWINGMGWRGARASRVAYLQPSDSHAPPPAMSTPPSPGPSTVDAVLLLTSWLLHLSCSPAALSPSSAGQSPNSGSACHMHGSGPSPTGCAPSALPLQPLTSRGASLNHPVHANTLLYQALCV